MRCRRKPQLICLTYQIMSYPTPAATVPDSFKEKVKAYGKGILSRWAPQRLIYNHPVRSSVCVDERAISFIAVCV